MAMRYGRALAHPLFLVCNHWEIGEQHPVDWVGGTQVFVHVFMRRVSVGSTNVTRSRQLFSDCAQTRFIVSDGLGFL